MQFSLPIKYKRSEIEGALDLPVNINLNGFPNKGNFKLFLDKKLSINELPNKVGNWFNGEVEKTKEFQKASWAEVKTKWPWNKIFKGKDSE